MAFKAENTSLVPKELDPEAVLSFLREGGQPKSFKEVKAHFGLRGNQARELKAILRGLAKGQLVKRPRGRKISIALTKGLVLGTLSRHPQGFGFLSPEDGKKDIFLPAEELKEAMHGDKVLVRLRRRPSFGPRQGAMASIVSRAVTELVGSVTKSQGRSYLVPENRRLPQRILLLAKGRGEVEEGQLIVARITSYPTRYRPAQAELVEILGRAGDEKIDAHIIMHKHGISHELPPEVVDEAARVPGRVSAKEAVGRLDLRSFPFVTIDPEEAKDFDDAIAVVPQAAGGTRLMVSISDVSHYVLPGSALDEEACARGTSVYFPEFAVPMLPAELSSGTCSLHPREDRLAITVIMDYDSAGNPADYSINKSVIRSQARLTYNWVKAILEDEETEIKARFKDLLPSFQAMKELALKLWQRREKQGSLDFDLPDPEIIRDPNGRILGIGRLQRNVAHRLVEEFMVAANERVAQFLAEKGVPLLYRVHEPPDEDQLAQLKAFLHSLGVSWRPRKGLSSKDYQQVIKQIEGTNLEQTVCRFLLRTLKQARYSGVNRGHFGLALKYYTHFTSPIRRYPDLVAHRVLNAVLNGESELKLGPPGYGLEELATHTSKRERAALDAEREMWDLLKAKSMVDKLGQTFSGVVTTILPFGFFVELKDHFVHGLVRLDSLSDDHYRVDSHGSYLKGRRQGRVIRLGDEVTVKVIRADSNKREVDFSLVAGKRGQPTLGKTR